MLNMWDKVMAIVLVLFAALLSYYIHGTSKDSSDHIIQNEGLNSFIKCDTSQADYFKIDQLHLAERMFGVGHEAAVSVMSVTNVAVFKSPLDGTYRKSHPFVSDIFRRQWFSLDFHAFVVMKTNTGVYISLEKQQDGIYIGKSDSSFHNIIYCSGKVSRKFPEELIFDDSNYSMSHLLTIIGNEKESYSLQNDNCQHFSKRVFDKLAESKHWEFQRPLEFLGLLFIFVTFLVLLSLFWYLLTKFKLTECYDKYFGHEFVQQGLQEVVQQDGWEVVHQVVHHVAHQGEQEVVKQGEQEVAQQGEHEVVQKGEREVVQGEQQVVHQDEQQFVQQGEQQVVYQDEQQVVAHDFMNLFHDWEKVVPEKEIIGALTLLPNISTFMLVELLEILYNRPRSYESEANVVMENMSQLCSSKSLCRIPRKFVESFFNPRRLQQLPPTVISDDDTIIAISTRTKVEHLFSLSGYLKVYFEHPVTQACNNPAKCGLLLKVTPVSRFDINTFNIQLVTDDKDYLASNIHYHHDELRAADMHVVLEKCDFIREWYNVSVSWKGRPVYRENDYLGGVLWGDRLFSHNWVRIVVYCGMRGAKK